MNSAVATFFLVIILLLSGLTILNEPQGAAVKGGVVELGGPKHWVERRYICDLPNRDDCIACCDEIKAWANGPAILIDYESCVFKVAPQMAEQSKSVWNNCIRVRAGLEPLESVVPFDELPGEIPEIGAPRKLLPLAPYKICSLLKKKPEKPRLFMPFHPIMIASLVC